ncbi:probable cytochrome P450 52A12 [Phialocephala subalpina]|uniref:Probable cytochrome P450 52A12 n=1 Tax=Phialocephala subalpina TaxID=576137 RepID=A0A1L7WGT7_9HELO|nr:probable cytochrome P450 52A12 [Phialocephala subalpina]
MAFSLYTLGGLVLVVGYLIQQLANYIRVARFKKQHKCEPETQIPQPERIIGYKLYKTQMEASKNKNLLEAGRQRYIDNGNTWSGIMMGRKFINTIDPENVKTILATNFKDFGLGQRQESFGPLLGQGIFTTDGAQWEHSRALVRPNFTKAQVADLDTFESHIQRLISKLPRDGSTVDLQPLFFQLTLDSATEFLFGESVNSLTSQEGSEQEVFGRSFDLAQAQLGKRSRLGKLVHLFRDKEFDQACKTVHQFVDNIILKALERSQPKDAEKSIDGKGEKERYVFLTEMLKSTRDPKQLRDELLNILLAGRDTTASLLSNTFHVLARRPDIWAKLLAEVDQLHGEKPDYETLRNMKYLKYLMNESLRLYPVVPGNARFANKDTVLPRGGGLSRTSPIYISKGQVVAYSTYVMHRRPDIYGPDAAHFRPERWAPEEGLRPGWGYLPFNGGPRICVGQQFALTEASYTTVRLVQEFCGLESRDAREWVEQLSLTMACGNGVKVGLVPREK